MKWFVYVLLCKNWKYYIGSTNNLKRRMREHNNWKSIFTKSLRPLKLVWYKEFDDLNDARIYEKYIKSQKDKSYVKTLIKTM